LKILDKYITRRFLLTYLYVVAIIVAIVVVVDYTEKADDFISRKAPTKAILLDYYLNFIPYWANYISPLMIFIATVFMTANMAAKTEIVAILSTGVSFLRFMRPYVIGATFIGMFTFFMVGWVIPKANKTRLAFENKYVKNSYYYTGRDVHLKIAPNVYAYLESYSNMQKTGYRFTLEHVQGTQLLEKLSAEQVVWDSTKLKWRIEDYKIRKYTAAGSHSLIRGAKLDSSLNMYPKDFESDYNLFETFDNTELQAFINQTISRGSDGVETYLIEKYQRYSSPFAVVILTIIGVILSARKTRGGVGLQIALGFILAFVYIIFFILSKGIAEKGGMPPLLAIWLPNLVFGLVGIVLFKTVPR
jgi:lipopolysaccharide export system permease protein